MMCCPYPSQVLPLPFPGAAPTLPRCCPYPALMLPLPCPDAALVTLYSVVHDSILIVAMWPYFCRWSYHLNTPLYGVVFVGPLQHRSNTAFGVGVHYPKSLTLLLEVFDASSY